MAAPYSSSPRTAPFRILVTILLVLPPCLLAFTHHPATSITIQITSSTQRLFSTAESPSHQQLSQSSLNKLETIKLALKRPRGASIGAEYSPTSQMDDGDLSILSMQLRKSKCAAIYTSDAASVGTIAKEQEASRGDFPGPVPVIYCGEDYVGSGASDATAVVVDYGQDMDATDSSLDDVGIIWKVNDAEQLKRLANAEKNAGGVFLLDQNMLPQTVEENADALMETLSGLPNSIVTIAPLPTMLPQNAEVSLGKHYASLGISSLLLTKACVGDDEDIKYSQHAIEGINKKSSSSFSMTGLTGSTNGHFGVASHGGEAKWRRKEL